jgi:TatD DNase family protein
MLIDTHAHLLDKKFDSDRDEMLLRARNNLVSHIIEIACEPKDWQPALEFAKANTGVYCACGIHPQEAKLATPQVLDTLEKIVSDERVVAIGEAGLDYYHENSPRDVQKRIFEHHIRLAERTGKPLVIHCRQAYSDIFEILNRNFPQARPGAAVVHCFSGSPEDAIKLIALGFYIGIDGPVTYPKAVSLTETVKKIPLESILIETDSPYLPPQKYRGERNEPAYINMIAREIATLKNISVEDVSAVTSKNAKTFFKIPGA